MPVDIRALADFICRHPRLMVLTGAGCSTESGIPDYRDHDGQWKRPAPMTFQAFTREPGARQRYWARSMIGWPRMAASRPGPAHIALAQLEAAGHVPLLVTQNVDGLHDAAGSHRVMGLHGRLDTVRCLACAATVARHDLQQRLQAANGGWLRAHLPQDVAIAPDGDAYLEGVDFSGFQVPACPACGGGVLKPDVVFFGELVPRHRFSSAFDVVQHADALLIAGSSLAVNSGIRLLTRAIRGSLPVVIINRGPTKGDDRATVRVEGGTSPFLEILAQRL